MNTSNRNKALTLSCAMILAASAMALPLQAQALGPAVKLPDTCDIVKTTACCPESLIDRLLALFSR